MTPEEARQLIGLGRHFSAEELESAFRRRSQELESKIERAPTPGLKEKYRRSLSQIEEAWEVLNSSEGAAADLNFPTVQPTIESTRRDVLSAVSEGGEPLKGASGQRIASKRHWGLIVSVAILVPFCGISAGCYFGYWLPKQKAAASDQAAQASATQEQLATLEKERQDAETRAAAAEQAVQQATADAEKAKQAEQAAAALAATPPAHQPSAPATGPVADQPWTNSLGMKFVPAGTNGVLFCIWDARVKDYTTFVEETGYEVKGTIRPDVHDNWQKGNTWKNPGFTQTPDDPVVGVDLEDAEAFCKWLTKKERSAGLLSDNEGYRLPTVPEWDKARGDTKYAWGNVWPPPVGAGNYDGEDFDSTNGLQGYRDGFEFTSPVGSFAANEFGLFDIGGNVIQWCENSEDPKGEANGSSWSDHDHQFMYSSGYLILGKDDRLNNLGFRVVLEILP